jgi:hypothetical protein
MRTIALPGAALRALGSPRAVALVCLLLAGCNWHDFDDVLDKAPVLALGAPDGYLSRDLGKVVLPLTVPSSRAPAVSARFLVAGTESPSLAVVELDNAGRAHTTVASKVEMMDMAGEANAAVKGAVQLADGRIVLGTPSYALNALQVIRGRIYFLQLIDGANGIEFHITRGADPGERILYGLGVAAAKLSTTAEDIIVASQQDVVALSGGLESALVAPAAGCDLAITDVMLEKYRFRALATGQLIEGGGEEIAVGVPHESPDLSGHVVILSQADGALGCPVVLSPPTPLPRFGTSVVASDLTGDGKLDLLVGAPPNAFLFAGPFVAGTSPAPTVRLHHPTIMDNGLTGDFGFRVLGFDVDGTGGPEMLVSAPELPVGGDTGVGRVFIFRRDGTFLAETGDNSPEAEESFGFSLGALPFAPTGCGTRRPVLLVGAIRQVFTFYRLPGGPPDPRCL